MKKKKDEVLNLKIIYVAELMDVFVRDGWKSNKVVNIVGKRNDDSDVLVKVMINICDLSYIVRCISSELVRNRKEVENNIRVLEDGGIIKVSIL